MIGGSLYYAFVDNLGTPRSLRRPSDNAEVWRWWQADAYGSQFPTNPTAGVYVSYDLRFPGQQYDGATGYHYNWMRDYDPATGRYLQADPLGLGGGLARYAYSRGNPLNLVDPLGLIPLPGWWVDAWASTTPGGNCATAECAAGLLPAKSENRSTQQIDRDLKQGICEILCGLASPIPGISMPKAVCEIPKKAAEYFGKNIVTSSACSAICQP